jgi:hypothetical protein
LIVLLEAIADGTEKKKTSAAIRELIEEDLEL